MRSRLASTRPLSRRAQERRNRDRWGSLILILIALALVGVLGGGGWYLYTRDRIDPVTFCPEKGPKAVTAVLLDLSDPMNAVQQTALLNRLAEVKNALSEGMKLAYFTLWTTEKDVLHPEIELCSPGTGDELNPLIANPKMAKRRWDEDFSARLDRVLKQLLVPDSTETSPIMESIQSIAVTTLPPQQNVPRRLVIVSDMIQHTKGLSQYKGKPNFEAFKNTEYYRSVRANLNELKVEIVYVRRATQRNVQGRDHIQFWQEYFSSMGATLERVTAIEG